MPYATNPIDQVRTFFEDSGGGGQPVLVYPGFTDPVEYAKASPLAQALRDDFRLIFADHRGQGRSDKPHEVGSYALTTRVADAVAILDALGIERVHYLGFSLGARLGFAIGEHARERVLSLALCGNQPYEWPDGPMLRAVSEAVAAGRDGGMVALVETWESSIGERFPEPGRTWMLAKDPMALDSLLRSSLAEGPISQDLRRWEVPCLLYASTEDEMHEGAVRAAAEIPQARFLSLPGHTHFSAERVAVELLPYVVELSTPPRPDGPASTPQASTRLQPCAYTRTAGPAALWFLQCSLRLRVDRTGSDRGARGLHILSATTGGRPSSALARTPLPQR